MGKMQPMFPPSGPREAFRVGRKGRLPRWAGAFFLILPALYDLVSAHWTRWDWMWVAMAAIGSADLVLEKRSVSGGMRWGLRSVGFVVALCFLAHLVWS